MLARGSRFATLFVPWKPRVSRGDVFDFSKFRTSMRRSCTSFYAWKTKIFFGLCDFWRRSFRTVSWLQRHLQELTMADFRQAVAGRQAAAAKQSAAGNVKIVYYPLNPAIARKTVLRNLRIGVREFLECPTKENIIKNLRKDECEGYPTRSPDDEGPSPACSSSTSSNSDDEEGPRRRRDPLTDGQRRMLDLLFRISETELDTYMENLKRIRAIVSAWAKSHLENKILGHAKRRGITVMRGTQPRVVKNFDEVLEAWRNLDTSDLPQAGAFGSILFEDFMREHEWNVSMTHTFMAGRGWVFTDPDTLLRPPRNEVVDVDNDDLFDEIFDEDDDDDEGNPPEGFAEGSPKKDNISQFFATKKSEIVKKFNKIGRAIHGLEVCNRQTKQEVQEHGHRTRRSQRGHFLRLNGR